MYVRPARDEYGQPIAPPLFSGPPPMRGRKLFAYQLFLIGIRDADDIERLWQEKKAQEPPAPTKAARRRRR